MMTQNDEDATIIVFSTCMLVMLATDGVVSKAAKALLDTYSENVSEETARKLSAEMKRQTERQKEERNK